MILKNTKDHHGAMAVSIHWLSVVLILILIVSGFRAAGTMDPAAKAAILRFHVLIAVGVLALTILRIVWWFGFDRKPNPIGGAPHWQERTAQAMHVLFLRRHLGNACQRRWDVGAEPRRVDDLWRRQRATS
jgi:cytochrome b561